MDVVQLMIKESLRRGYSSKTIKTYIHCIKQFQKKCQKEPKKITKNDVRLYIDSLIEKDASGSTINVHLNAIKFLLEEILRKKILLDIRYSKIPKRLPSVLTKEEVQRLIKAVENQRHKLIVKLLYSSGLRLSELVHLRKENIELDKNLGLARRCKGRKDRLFLIAERLRDELKQYIKKNCLEPESWLFKGRKGRHLSQQAVQEIVKRAAKKAGIPKNVHPHTLRHSFATHLIEDGYDVASVQFLLGHNSSETTMKYVHMSSPKMVSVRSPYDSLKE